MLECIRLKGAFNYAKDLNTGETYMALVTGDKTTAYIKDTDGLIWLLNDSEFEMAENQKEDSRKEVPVEQGDLARQYIEDLRKVARLV